MTKEESKRILGKVTKYVENSTVPTVLGVLNKLGYDVKKYREGKLTSTQKKMLDQCLDEVQRKLELIMMTTNNTGQSAAILKYLTLNFSDYNEKKVSNENMVQVKLDVTNRGGNSIYEEKE